MLKILEALASDKRLAILEALKYKDCTLQELVDYIKLSDASIVRHVGILEDVELVEREKKLTGHIISLNKHTMHEVATYLESLT